MSAASSSGAPAARSGLLELAAPAKVNLGLRIVGTRPDGYHLLDSLFVPLDLADSLVVELLEYPAPRVEVELEVDGKGSGTDAIPSDDRNLAVRAARAFLDAAGLSARLAVSLHKRIPTAAGLGGGSSDAGAVLRGLRQLFPAAISDARLSEVALGLGADVPYFLDPRPARVSGVGERIEPIPGVPGLCLLLANPGISLATAEVYAGYDSLRAALTTEGAGSTMPPLAVEDWGAALSGLLSTGAGGDALFENHLEPPAARLCPEISLLRRSLAECGALGTGMSGSGATVFGVFADEASARSAETRVAVEPGVWARVAFTTRSR